MLETARELLTGERPARSVLILAVTAEDNVLRLAPSLNIEAGQVDEAIEMLDRACGTLAESV